MAIFENDIESKVIPVLRGEHTSGYNAPLESGGEGTILIRRLLSRKELGQRWSCSTQTVKRRTRDGLLHPLRFNSRMIRYSLSEVIRIEQQAGERQ